MEAGVYLYSVCRELAGGSSKYIVHFSGGASHQPHRDTWISLLPLQSLHLYFISHAVCCISPTIFSQKESCRYNCSPPKKKQNGKVKMRSGMWTEIKIQLIVHIIVFKSLNFYPQPFAHFLLILSIFKLFESPFLLLIPSLLQAK